MDLLGKTVKAGLKPEETLEDTEKKQQQALQEAIKVLIAPALVSQGLLDGQHDPRELAARGGVSQRLPRLAGVDPHLNVDRHGAVLGRH